MEDKKPFVVVLSRNYSTGLSVIRSLGAAGYTVDLVASAYKAGKSAIAAKSKYVRRYVEVVSQKVKGEEEGGDELLDALLQFADSEGQKPVLFPTDDYTTSVMDQNRSILEPHYIMPTIVGGGDGCLTHRMDKTVQAEMARKAGLLTPLEWIISLREDEIEIPADMVYPCFCKPLESVTGYKKEMAACQNSEELLLHLKKLQRNFADRSILVQEFLKIDDEIDLSGVCLDQEIIIPAIIKKLNVAKYEKGVTLAGKVVSCDAIAEIRTQIEQMLKQFHYVGMFDMELNIVGDRIYFNEVNLRSGGPNYAYFMSGVNLPALFVKEALGVRHTKEEEQVKKLNQTFVYEKVAWEDYIHGYMSKNGLQMRLDTADITLLCNQDDPVPGQFFRKEMKLTALNQRRRKAKRNLVRKARRFKRRIRRRLGKIKRGLRSLLKPLRKVKYTLLGYPQAKRANQRKPFSEKPRVLVAGRNYCSNLCMARSLGEAGYEVEVLRIFQVKPKWYHLLKRLKPDAHSEYIKAYHVCISRRKSRVIVNRLIRLADKYRKMLLIPADDLVANIADQYYDELKQYYLMPNVNDQAGEIGRLMSKEVQKELAKEAGLPVINSCVIRVAKRGEVVIPDTVHYPCFVKPNISKNSSKSRMRKCESEEELLATLTEFSQGKSIEMMVEDFVEIKQEFAILGLSTKQGVMAPGFFCTEEGGHDERRGVAIIGKVLSCDQERKLIDDIVKFIETLHFDGLFDVDLIQTTDGTMYFVELNLRFGASGYAITGSGVNLPGMFADYMYFETPIDPSRTIENPGKLFISEKVMLEEYVKGYLTKTEMEQKMQEVDIHFVQNDADQAAYRHFKKFYPVAKLMKLVHKLKNKA